MQRHQYQNNISNQQQQITEELAEEIELDREHREYRLSTRMARGIIDVDTQSTLSDALLWMADATDTTEEDQRYQCYLSDGGAEPADRYMNDFDNLRPSISNMQRPAYKEWFRHNIYNRWIQERWRRSECTTDLDLADLTGIWLSYRPQPRSTDNSTEYSSVESSVDADTAPWHPVPPHLTVAMTPPSSPSVHSHISSNRYSPLAEVEEDEGNTVTSL